MSNIIAILLSTSLGLGHLFAEDPDKQKEKWVHLTQCVTEGNWKVNDEGIIQLQPRHGEQGWKRYGSYLWLRQSYADFICRFEYLHPKGGNSGFYFRVKDKNNPVETGIEIQILDSFGKKGKLTHHDCGGVIFTQGPAKNMSKPANQWNQMTVRCVKSHLQVWLNGEKIQDLQLDKTELNNRPLNGHIGFQDHGLPMQLRNISIQEVSKP
ncbi:DUF1080 domain-containing protein [Verrucomicrobiaceae bacterium N1E253]|uniref:DUF1080 domain-containing protein n=1 Tax=Oceaniferula marina TaxID=2748318 RepID=A0A851GB54_9BACT|nr:DUF1080 domain-containing protein [Oceaniferula marina]NWK54843.1 DUF1080 domain-containing protein [Oceaniferula marina]